MPDGESHEAFANLDITKVCWYSIAGCLILPCLTSQKELRIADTAFRVLCSQLNKGLGIQLTPVPEAFADMARTMVELGVANNSKAGST